MSQPPSKPMFSSDRDYFKQVIGNNEVGNDDRRIYGLSHAPTAGSGYTVGRFQHDFGADKGKADTLVDGLKATGLLCFGIENCDAKAEEDRLRRGLATKSNAGALDEGQKQRVRAFLATRDGRDLVDGWDDQQADRLTRQTQEVIDEACGNPRYRARNDVTGDYADPSFREWAGSPEFHALIADHINQFGPQGCRMLKDFVAGRTAEDKCRGEDGKIGSRTQVKLDPDRAFDYRAFLDFEAHTCFGRREDGGVVLRGRRETTVAFMRRHAIIDAKTAQERMDALGAVWVEPYTHTSHGKQEQVAGHYWGTHKRPPADAPPPPPDLVAAKV